MTRTCSVLLLAVAALLGAASPGQANLWHRPRLCFAPCLPCGPGLLCRLPLLVRCAPVAPPVVVTRPVLVAPAPAVQAPPALPPAPIVSVPAPLLPAAPAPLTHQQFAQAFKPLPGRYEVSLIHPGSKCPVAVCFTLPEGCPRIIVHRRDLIFDYGRHEVHIRFQIGGRVKVTTH
jgi:hypothetical protein